MGFGSSTSSSGNFTSTQNDRARLPSQAPKIPDGTFIGNFHIPTRYRAGARLVRLPQAKTDWRLAEGNERTSTTPVAEQASMPLTSLDEFGESAEQQPGMKPVVTSPDFGTSQQRGHRRNKTTISNFSELLTRPAGRGRTFSTPAKPQVSSSMSMPGPDDELDQAEDNLFALSGSTFADNFLVERESLLPDYSHFATPLFAKTMSATEESDIQLRSTVAADVSLRDDLLRTQSGLSDDSDYASTIADDSWNPVEEFVASSSPNEVPELTHAVSLFDMKSADTTPKQSPGKIYPNTLDNHEMAGQQHNTVVQDFAYATRKAPVSDEEWERVQYAPAPFAKRTRPALDKVSLADTIDMAVGEENGDKRPVTVREPEVLQGPTSPATERAKMMPIASIDEVLLRPTVYEPPIGRVIAEDAGSSMDCVDGSDSSDGHSDTPLRLAQKPRPQLNDIVVPTHEQSEAREDAVTNDLVRNDASLPDNAPFKLRKPRAQNAQGHHSGSGSKLRRLSAHIPEFLSHNDQQQRTASAPLLDSSHVPITQQPKRAGSLRRVFDKVKDKYSSKRTISGAASKQSLMRRALKRVDDYLVDRDL
jgi:hypothetical protein